MKKSVKTLKNMQKLGLRHSNIRQLRGYSTRKWPRELKLTPPGPRPGVFINTDPEVLWQINFKYLNLTATIFQLRTPLLKYIRKRSLIIIFAKNVAFLTRLVIVFA